MPYSFCSKLNPGANILIRIDGYIKIITETANAIHKIMLITLEKYSSAAHLPLDLEILLYCGIIALSVELVKTPSINSGIDIARKIASVISLAP